MTAVLDALRTADGERLAATLRHGPGSTCVVLAHGFLPVLLGRRA